MAESAGEEARGSSPEWVMPAFALVVGAALSGWLGGYVHHDTLPILTQILVAPEWLRDANGYPLEIAWMVLVRVLPGDARIWWNVLGCAHLAAATWLLVRIARHALPDRRPAAWLIPLLFLANPYTLRFFIGLNSVALLCVCLLLWSERSLADSPRGARVALVLLGLSRLDGLVFAFALAAAPVMRKERGRRNAALDLLALLPVALVYPVLWKLLLGQWFGMAESLSRFEEILGFEHMGLLAMLRWLRGAWLEVAGDAFLLLAAAGVLALLSERSRRAQWFPLLGPVALVHGFVILSGMQGRPIDYRYFWPVLPYAALWVVLAATQLGERFGRTPREQLIGGALVVLAGCAPYVLSLRKLDELHMQQQVARADAAAVARCWRAQGPRDATLLVVPGGIRGDVIYELADETAVAEVLFEKAYFFEPGRYEALPLMWFASMPPNIAFAQSMESSGRAAEVRPCDGFSGRLVFAGPAVPQPEAMRAGGLEPR